MKSKIATTWLLTSALLLPIAGYAADGGTDLSGPKSTFVKDSVITVKRKAEIAGTLPYTARINVDTDHNGAVFLSGHTRTQADVDKVGSLARGVKGVTSVQNKIAVKSDI